MSEIKTLADLKKKQEEMLNRIRLRDSAENPGSFVQVKVAMATCGIASGAKEVMEYFVDELDKRSIRAIVTQTGCMGYCYAEPTVEVTLPGRDPIVFGYVTVSKARSEERRVGKEGRVRWVRYH